MTVNVKFRFSLQRLFLVVCGLAVVAALAYAFMPQPIAVDVATVSRGPLQVTVEEDGKTRIKERYVISAPLAGNMRRIELHEGDAVSRGITLVATIEPHDPDLLDAREIAEREAKVKSAEAALRLAESAREKAKAALDFAEAELGRIQQAYRSNSASRFELDDANLHYRTAAEEYRGAAFSEEIARFELDLARAALIRTRPGDENSPDAWEVEIRSPIDGQVLRVFQESAAMVTAGTQLIEVGDPADLELEIDVLSQDAVRVSPGAKVIVEDWGGEAPLLGTVRVVEPSGFTKISALGVEEQRVNVIADLNEPRTQRAALGDGYRVEARIVVWEGRDVLKVPASALFRRQGAWAVFRVDGRRAVLQSVEIGRQGQLEAEVLDGLYEGDRVIVYPSDKIRNGVAVIAQ
jgi:HlyD family secretion protein